MCDNCCGCVGPQGPQGIQGFQGPQGIQGPAGQNGGMGGIGPMGVQGPKGDVGPQGSTGVTGAQGPAGAMGPSGAQGLAGADGHPGSIGPQGPQGMEGPQGLQGIQGVPGKDCNPECCQKVYLSMFSEVDQPLTAFGGVQDFAQFTSAAIMSSPLDFDISLAATQGKIKFLKSGVYSVAWDADGQLAPPFPGPVPSWALGFYLNGAFVNGSGVAGFSPSPDDDATCLSSVQCLAVNAGDIIQLRNLSKFPINLKSVHPELVQPMTCASFSAIKIG